MPISYQQIGAGEAPRQGVDGHLGGEGTEEHRAGRRGLRIGIGQPAVQHREARLDAEGDEDQPAAGRIQADEIEGQAVAGTGIPDGTSQQQHPGTHLHHQVSHTGGQRVLAATRQHQEHRGDGQQLPEHEQGQQVAREHRAHRAAGIGKRSHVLHRSLMCSEYTTPMNAARWNR